MSQIAQKHPEKAFSLPCGIKKGDIFVIHYRFDPIASLIRYFLKCEYNHCAWVYSEKYLIENKRNGVLLSPIKKYLNKKSCYFKVVRLNLSEEKINFVLESALKEKKKQSYWKFLISFLLIGIGWEGKLPRPTCSGFIAEQLSRVNFYFNHYKEPHLITPKDILNSTEVKNV